jgi:hypothetical protein
MDHTEVMKKFQNCYEKIPKLGYGDDCKTW